MYDVNPIDRDQAKLWLEQSSVISAVRTTEMLQLSRSVWTLR